MNDEIFDVVNDADEVMDRRSRAEVHRLGLMHRAVDVLVFWVLPPFSVYCNRSRKNCCGSAGEKKLV